MAGPIFQITLDGDFHPIDALKLMAGATTVQLVALGDGWIVG